MIYCITHLKSKLYCCLKLNLSQSCCFNWKISKNSYAQFKKQIWIKAMDCKPKFKTLDRKGAQGLCTIKSQQYKATNYWIQNTKLAKKSLTIRKPFLQRSVKQFVLGLLKYFQHNNLEEFWICKFSIRSNCNYVLH